MAITALLRPKAGMKTKFCTFMYMPKAATAVEERPMRIRFTPKAIREFSDCMTIAGAPIAYIFLIMERLGRKPRRSKEISLFIRRLKYTASASAVICPMTVAAAAPFTPKAGAPQRPKIRIGSSTMLSSAPTSCDAIESAVRPVDCKRR